MTRFNRTVALSALSLSLATLPCLAGDWYLVANVGESTFNDLRSSSAVAPFAIGPALIALDPGGGFVASAADIQVSKDDTDTLWRIGGGYQINDYFAVEAAYVDAGEADVETTLGPGAAFAPVPSVSLRETVTYEASGIEVSGLGQYPVTEKLHVLGRLGVIYLERKRSSRVAFDPIDQPAWAGAHPRIWVG